MKKTNKLKKIIFATFIFLFAITSCEIGLGAALDLTRPKIEIESPTTQSVAKSAFIIKGIATDNQEVSRIEITITNDGKTILQLKWEGGNFLSYDSKNNKWQEYSNATISGTLTRYEWTLKPDVTNIYNFVFITAIVFDGYGNLGSTFNYYRLY